MIPKKINKTFVFLTVLLSAAGILGMVLGGKNFHRTSLTGQSQAAAKYFCPMHPHYVSDKPGDCPICQMRLVPALAEPPQKGKVIFYRNPMDARITSLVPAKDSMGMDYIPVYEEHEQIPQNAEETCAVHECPMIKEGKECPMLIIGKKGEKLDCPVCKARIDLQEKSPMSVPAGYGAVLISPQRRQLVGIRTGGVVKKRLTKTIRSSGKVAYDPELYQAELEYLQTIKKYKQETYYRNDPIAQNSAERARLKLISMGIPEDMILEIEKNRQADKRLVYAKKGEMVWVYAPVFEYEIPLVKAGDILEISIPSVPEFSVQAPLLYMDNSVDPVTRSLRTRALANNDQGYFKPDMFVDVLINTDLGESLTVPAEAVAPQGKSFVVFVDKGEGLFEPREVLLGQKVGDVYQVKSGLSEGEKVVTNGNFLLDSESRIKAAVSHD